MLFEKLKKHFNVPSLFVDSRHLISREIKTIGNNTYTWFRTGTNDSIVIEGDSTFAPATSGSYYATITNAIASQLTLYTDTIGYAMPVVATNENRIAAAMDKEVKQAWKVYPNPAKDIVYVQTNGTANFLFIDSNGTVLLSQTITNSGAVTVSTYSPGIYFIENTTTHEKKRIVIVR